MATPMFPVTTSAAAGSSAASSSSATIDDGKMVDLRDTIDVSECYARNEALAYPMSNLFVGDSTLGCKSDTDEQLILHISFREFVKIKSIKLTGFNNCLDPENNPTKIHLYVNRENLGFEDIDEIDPTQTLDLTDADLQVGSDPIPLKFVKYQRVKSLTIYLEENNGGPITALGSISLYGKPVTTVDMKNFKATKEHM